MICRECQHVFSAYEEAASFDAAVREEAVFGLGGSRCPSCGSEDIEEAMVCMHCEREVGASALEQGLCDACVEETKESFAWLWGSLTPPQQQWILCAIKREQ